jgi:LPXTG-motif cell wall-anchored protein
VTANYEITKTAGALTINPVTAQVTVTIKGNEETYTYDGTEKKLTNAHTEDVQIEGVPEKDAGNLYKAKDWEFTGTYTVRGTDAGDYYTNISADQYENLNDNFTNVEFVIAQDGHLTIEPLRGVVLTIKGNSATYDYDGNEHSVEGFTTESSDPLFTESDWYFDGEAVTSGTKVGTYAMGLDADQFSVASKNFADVTFDVTDGELEIVAADEQDGDDEDDADDDEANKDGSSKKHADKDDDSAEDEASDGTPKTGDATNALLPVGMIAVAGGAAVLGMRARRRVQE